MNRRPEQFRRLAVLALCFGFIALPACHVDRAAEVSDSESRQVRCDIEKYYVTNLCEDELAYLDWAAAYEEYPRMEDLTQENLQKVTREFQDADRAAALFYQRSLLVPENRRFYEYLDRREAELLENVPDYSNANVLLLMVPGMFYADNPEIGADGAVLRRLANELGLQSHLLEIEQTGTVERNAEIICDYIHERDDVDGIIVASVSKGGGDFKKAVQMCGGQPDFDRVIGWYNIGGINRGSLLVNEIDGHWQYRWEAKYYFCLSGYNYDGFLSMRGGPEAPLNYEMDLPDHVLLINVVGVPTYRFVTERAKPFYLHLSQFGPNDGISLLSDVYIPGGITWVSWRNDHYFIWPISEQKMQAFMTYIVEQQMPVVRRNAARRLAASAGAG